MKNLFKSITKKEVLAILKDVATAIMFIGTVWAIVWCMVYALDYELMRQGY